MALWLNQQSEPTSWRASPTSEQQLVLLCDDLLQDPIYALLEAFQRRRAAQIEVITKSPAKDLLDLIAEHPDCDLLLTIESLSPLTSAGIPPPATAIVALVQPVVLASNKVSEKIKDWSDLRNLRLALPEDRQHALGKRAATLLATHQFPWPEARQAAVFQSVDGESLARAVALGRADAAILWQPNALQFTMVASAIKLPLADHHSAKVTLVQLGNSESKPLLVELSQFLQGAWAREVFETHGYQMP